MKCFMDLKNNIRSSLSYLFSIKNMLLIVVAVIFSVYLTYNMLANYKMLGYSITANDMLSRLYGILPESEQSGSKEVYLAVFFVLLMPFTLFLYLTSNYISTYILPQTYFMLIRYKSIRRWFLNNFVVLIFHIFFYFAFFNFLFYAISGFFTSFNCNSTYSSNLLHIEGQNRNVLYILASFFILQCSSVMVVLCLQYLTSLLNGSLSGFAIGVFFTTLAVLISLFIKENTIFIIKNIVMQLDVFSGTYDLNKFSLTVFFEIIIVGLALLIGFKLFLAKDIEIRS